MSKRTWYGYFGLLILLTGCATGYKLVRPPGEVSVGPFAVSPQIEWSSVRAAKGVFWTVDGLTLDALYFSDPIRDGQALFVSGEKAKVPRFRSGMTANEVAELVADSFVAGGASQPVVRGLAPRKFAGSEGFGFELDLLASNGLEKRALVAGMQRNGSLYLVIYNAARQYYYDRHVDPVREILSSLRVAGGPSA